MSEPAKVYGDSQLELVEWVAEFLSHWEPSSILHNEAAKVLVTVLRHGCEAPAWLPSLTAVQDLFLKLESREA
jgi:hypothetical protein